jgi:hypothetical protein
VNQFVSRGGGFSENRGNVVLRVAPMGRAKRKQMPPARRVEVAGRRVEREAPLHDRAVETVLKAVYGDGEQNSTRGIGYAVVAGTALWTIIGLIVVLLI